MTTQADTAVQLSFRVRIDAAYRADFLAAVTALAEAAGKEEGVLGYSVGEDLWEPGVYVFIERYSSERALAEHQETAECRHFLSVLPGWLSSDTVVRVDGVNQKTTFSLTPAR
jgi:quinol monooxygenase YgiN